MSELNERVTITDGEILECISVNLLDNMTLDQRSRAIEIVKREFIMPSVVYDQIRDILRDSKNWTEVVFGPEE